MASSRLKTKKDGTRYYEIRVRMGRGKPELTTRWNVPEGWSQKSIEHELAKQEVEFEKRCHSGEVLTHAQKREKAEQEARERAKIKTVKQYAECVFLPAKTVFASENTRVFYEWYIDHEILPVIGNMLLVDVTPAILSKLLLDHSARGYAHSTCVNLYATLGSLFDMAFNDDSIPMNPMQKVKRPVLRKDEKLKAESDKAFTLSEVKRIKECLRQEPLKWQAYVILSIDTGARRGEICGLKWADIDFDKMSVTIQRNIQYSSSKGVYETTPKNGKMRIVDIGEETIKLLKQLRLNQANSCMSEYVFTSVNSPKPMNPSVPSHFFKTFGKRYNIADFHPHKLRHTSASIAIINGADVVSVSRRLGHSNTATTLRMYAHANDESIRRAGEILRKALS